MLRTPGRGKAGRADRQPVMVLDHIEVEVQPADHSADVERGRHRIELGSIRTPETGAERGALICADSREQMQGFRAPRSSLSDGQSYCPRVAP